MHPVCTDMSSSEFIRTGMAGWGAVWLPVYGRGRTGLGHGGRIHRGRKRIIGCVTRRAAGRQADRDGGEAAQRDPFKLDQRRNRGCPAAWQTLGAP